MSEGFQVQHASYQAWIAPDHSIQQDYPSLTLGETQLVLDREDLSSWVRLCRAGYVYACYGPKSTMYLYGRPEDLMRVAAQWRALASAVAQVRVTLIGEGKVDFLDTAEFPVPGQVDALYQFIEDCV